jgi:prephenate dehydrogenase
MKIALLHPGEMGAAIGGALSTPVGTCTGLRLGDHRQPGQRAVAARLIDDVTLATLLAETDLVISVCPPHAALAIAEEVAAASRKRNWIYLDANAVSSGSRRNSSKPNVTSGLRKMSTHRLASSV